MVVNESKMMNFERADAKAIGFFAPCRVRAWDLTRDTNILVLSLDI